MSRELDLVAREFQKVPATVLRAEVSLYQSNMQRETGRFIKSIEQECRRKKMSHVTLLAIVQE